MITWDDFRDVDGHYIAVMDGAILSIELRNGVFRFTVFGALGEELPKPATTNKEPTDKEKVIFLKMANKIEEAHRLGKRSET